MKFLDIWFRQMIVRTVWFMKNRCILRVKLIVFQLWWFHKFTGISTLYCGKMSLAFQKYHHLCRDPVVRPQMSSLSLTIFVHQIFITGLVYVLILVIVWLIILRNKFQIAQKITRCSLHRLTPSLNYIARKRMITV